MNTNLPLRKKFILLILIVCAGVFAFLGFSAFKSKAVVQTSTSLYLPRSQMEFDNFLNTPQHVYVDDSVCAVIQNNNELWISKNGGNFVKSGATFTSLQQQIKRLDQNTLLVSDQAIIYKIDLTSDTFAKTELRFVDQSNDEPVGCTLFDYKDGLLVVNHSNDTLLYKIENGVAISKENLIFDASANSPVAIFNQNVYYVNMSNILCSQSTDITQDTHKIVELKAPQTSVPLTAQKIITDGQFVYAICSSDIYKIDLLNKSLLKLQVVESENYDLGNLLNPSGFCFKGENLFISDSVANTLQEFSVSDNKLTFTGFAVASNKTAYNRVGVSADDIEYNNGRIAVLNTTKKTFTVINDISASLYDQNNFALNLVFKPTDTFIPDAFALGTNSALLVNKSTKIAKLYDFESKTLSEDIAFGVNSTDLDITDVAWQNGKYFVAKRNLENLIFKLHIFSVLEGQTTFTKILETQFESTSNLPLIAVDVFENVFLTNSDDNCIYKHQKTQTGYDAGTAITLSPVGVKKLATDLAGGLFALKQDSVILVDQAQNSFNLQVNTANAFAMSFEDNKVFFVNSDSEQITFTTDLPVLALSELTVPQDFKIDGENAKDVNDLTIYSVKEGANVYSLKTSNDNLKFIFSELVDELNLKGAHVCDYLYQKDFTSNEGSSSRSVNFGLLVGKSQEGNIEIYLVNKNELIEEDKKATSLQSQSAYTTTPVRAYYLPIITQNAEFTIKNSNGIVSIPKGVKLNLISQIEFLGREFYYAKVEINQTEIFAYIPIKFTAKVLAKDYPETSFTTAKVNATTVYSDSALSLSQTTLTEGSEIRVLEQTETFTKIAYLSNGEWIEGYISSTSIMTDENNTLRNVLIILAITISVCLTSLFLVLRKKG